MGDTAKLNEMELFTELRSYKDYKLDVSARPSDPEWLGCYEIIFEVNDERYYCFVDAPNLDEALGRFFVLHPHINYDMVVEHEEVGASINWHSGGQADYDSSDQ